jgi:hypothetical protein
MFGVVVTSTEAQRKDWLTQVGNILRKSFVGDRRGPDA